MGIEQNVFWLKHVGKNLAATTVGRVGTYLRGPPKRFLIITNGRTGSNLLVSLLRQSPHVRMYGEVIGTHYLRQPFVRKKISNDGPDEFLNSLFARTLTESHVGIKILYAQFDEAYGQHHVVPNLHLAKDYLTNHRDIHVVHLLRENLLDVVLSIALARDAGVHIGSDYGETVVELPVDWCREQFECMEGEVDEHRALFSGHPYMEVTYQGILDRPTQSISEICQFLGLPNFRFTVSQKRQRRKSREDVITNYNELRSAFAETRYEHFFDDADI